MRQLFTLIFLIVLIQIRGYAQTEEPKSRFGYGVIGGMDLYGTYRDGAKMKKVGGGMVGIDLSYTLGNRKFQPTIHFQPNWEQFSYRINYEQGVNNYLFQSVNLPVFLRYKLADTKRLEPFLEFGASYKWKLKYYYGGRDVSCGPFLGASCFENTYKEELIEPSRKGDVVILLGVGVELDLNSVKVPVSIRLNDGIDTFTMTYSRPGRPLTGLKTQTVQIVTGVTF